MIKIDNLNSGIKINNWSVIKIIDQFYDSIIIEVLLDSVDPVDLVNNYNLKTIWIMKIRKYNDISEGEYYFKYELNKCIYALQSPKNELSSYGKLELVNDRCTWSITEKYDEDISKNYIFAKNNWIHLLISVIEFLRYIHREKKVVHGDLKAKNILYKTDSEILFKVCDYESLTPPNITDICKKAGYIGYYYYSIGCAKNESFFSYRMDLEAFGLILWAVLISKSKEEFVFDWQKMCHKLYKKKIIDTLIDINSNYALIDNLKKMTYMYNMIDIIDKYYEIISTVDWKSNEPPDNNIYDELISLQNFAKQEIVS
jgi:serine/threonine protein kinase